MSLKRNIVLALSILFILLNISCDNKLSPEKIKELCREGDSYIDINFCEGALKKYEEVLEVAPDNIHALTGRGRALSKMGRYSEGIACFDKVIYLVPDYKLPWKEKGIACFKLKIYNDAIKVFDEAVKLDPRDPEIWFYKGQSYERLGDNSKAILCYERALEINPEYEGAIAFIEQAREKEIAIKEISLSPEELLTIADKEDVGSEENYYNKMYVLIVLSRTVFLDYIEAFKGLYSTDEKAFKENKKKLLELTEKDAKMFTEMITAAGELEVPSDPEAMKILTDFLDFCNASVKLMNKGLEGEIEKWAAIESTSEYYFNIQDLFYSIGNIERDFEDTGYKPSPEFDKLISEKFDRL